MPGILQCLILVKKKGEGEGVCTLSTHKVQTLEVECKVTRAA